MDARFLRPLAPIFILFLIGAGHAAAQGYPGFPNTIMAPERGALPHHRAEAPPARPAHTARSPTNYRYGRRHIARGSSGSVLPTPLPRTQAIPPEGGGVAAVRIAPPAQGPTVVPSLVNPVPNLPHGVESFQDRASRCAFQQGLYNVPGNMSTPYMGACLQ